MFGDNPAMIDRVLHRFRGAGATQLGDLAAVLEESRDASDVAALEAEWRRVEAALSGYRRVRRSTTLSSWS